MKNIPGTLLQRPPLYQQAVTVLRERIAAMSPADCLPSERLLAVEYGISLATVREAIRILASEGRVERKQGKGTFVTAPPAGVIAILLDQDISDPRTSSIYLRIAQEVRRQLDTDSLPSRLYIGRNPPAEPKYDFQCPEFFQDLEEGRICGIIGVLFNGRAAWIESLPARGIHPVGFGWENARGATEDKRQLLASAVDEFIRRGRRRIGLVAWRGFDHLRTGNADFFRQVLGEAGLPVIEPWIKDDIYPTLDGSGWEMFREIWSATPEHPDGLIVMDDFFLGGVGSAIREMGIRIPEQLEIAARLSNRPRTDYPFPLIAWQSDIPAIARALVDAETGLLRREDPEPSLRVIPALRAPELDSPNFGGTVSVNTENPLPYV